MLIANVKNICKVDISIPLQEKVETHRLKINN